MKQKTIRWIAGTAILPLMISGCQLLPAEETFPQPTLVKTFEQAQYTTTKVQRGDLVRDITVSGKQISKENHELSFGVGGEKIGAVYVEQGELVSAGQLLMELVQPVPSEEVIALQNKVENMKLEKGFLEENMALEEKLQDAKLAAIDEKLSAVRDQINAGGNVTALKAKETELVAARADQEAEKTQKLGAFTQQIKEIDDALYIDGLRLEEMAQAQAQRQIYAPVDGVVSSVQGVGTLMHPGNIAITIADMSIAYFRVEVSDRAIFPVGEKVVITGETKTVEAVCVSPEEIGMPDSSMSGMALVYFQLVEPDPGFLAGSITRILETRKNALYVDKDAVRNFATGTKVYIMGADGVRQAIDVEIGMEVDGNVEIVSGLDEGTELILS